jgi:hypothetical protein
VLQLNLVQSVNVGHVSYESSFHLCLYELGVDHVCRLLQMEKFGVVVYVTILKVWKMIRKRWTELQVTV